MLWPMRYGEINLLIGVKNILRNEKRDASLWNKSGTLNPLAAKAAEPECIGIAARTRKGNDIARKRRVGRLR